MRNNETGEFELVVGNKQLLSGFFIVVLLFAVAFAMGYVVGENSRTAKAQTEMAAGGSTPPTVADARPQAASGSPANAAVPAPSQPAETAPAASPDPAPPQPTTQPAREVREPAREVRQPEPKPRREPTPAPVREAPPKTESLGLSTPQEPPAGSYWQVTSTTNPESAQNLLHALRGKGFPAILGPGPNGFTRVLVGPHHENGSLSRSKTDLESAGFSKLVLVKH